jgi:tyrosine-specific transport protein
MYKKRGKTKEYKGFFGRNKLWVAVCTLIGTVVGAGILGIPYIIAKVGILYGLILILLIGSAYIFINLFVGEIILRTKEKHQLVGYVGKYLGPWGKRMMFFSILVGSYGALTAYLIGEGAALYSIFQFGSPLLYSLIFFALTFYIVYRGLKATGKAELILISLLFFVVLIIGFFSIDKIDILNFKPHNLSNIFLPYGVIVFAFLGLPSIPEMREELGKETKKLKKAIIIGSIVPIFLYILFSVIIIGIVGLNNFELLQPNERIATIALGMYSFPVLGIFANFLAILAMLTSFLTIAMALVCTFEYDYKFSKKISFLLTFSLPMFIVLFDLTSFITILGLTGAIAGGIDGILIILTHWKAKLLGNRKPEYMISKSKVFAFILILMFIFGIVIQFL